MNFLKKIYDIDLDTRSGGQVIEGLLSKRREQLTKDPDHHSVDSIAECIITKLKDDYNYYSVDFVIETLTHLGHAPNVVYDDNGMFAVSSFVLQPVVTGDDRLDGDIVVFTCSDQWFKTIRQALWHYLTEL